MPKELDVATALVAGLSIEDGMLRVVVLDHRGEPVVVDAAEADVAEGIVRDGRVLDQAALARRIGELWQALDLGGVPTGIGLHPLDGTVRTVPVTAWPAGGWPSEVRSAVSERRQALSADLVWSADRFDDDDRVFARVVTCRREDLSNGAWAARRSGVWVTGVELAGLAVERAVRPPAEPHVLLVDAAGLGAVTFLLFERGAVVRSWRAPRDASMARRGPMTAFVLDAATADALAHDATSPLDGLSSTPADAARPVDLIGPGDGLAADSPVPLPAFAVALGLALGVAGVGVAPVDLQAALLNTGATRLQEQLGSRRPLLTPAPGPDVPGIEPPAAHEPPAEPTGTEPTDTEPTGTEPTGTGEAAGGVGFATGPTDAAWPTEGPAAVSSAPALPPAPRVPVPQHADDRPRSVGLLVPGRAPLAGASRTLAVEPFLAGPSPLLVPADRADRAAVVEGDGDHEEPPVGPADGADVGTDAAGGSHEAPGTALPLRSRRNKTVAVVAGAAAVGSFLVVRTISGSDEPRPASERPSSDVTTTEARPAPSTTVSSPGGGTGTGSTATTGR